MKPKLIHPIEVKLHRMDKKTPMNPSYDEPEGEQLYLPPVAIIGQISYRVHNAAHQTGLGNAPEAAGYVLCHAPDWDLLKGGVGDLLELSCAAKCAIVEVRPAAHYRGRHCFYKLFFDRGRGIT